MGVLTSSSCGEVVYTEYDRVWRRDCAGSAQTWAFDVAASLASISRTDSATLGIARSKIRIPDNTKLQYLDRSSPKTWQHVDAETVAARW